MFYFFTFPQGIHSLLCQLLYFLCLKNHLLFIISPSVLFFIHFNHSILNPFHSFPHSKLLCSFFEALTLVFSFIFSLCLSSYKQWSLIYWHLSSYLNCTCYDRKKIPTVFRNCMCICNLHTAFISWKKKKKLRLSITLTVSMMCFHNTK